jgi:serine/threonine protein kinase
MLPNELGTIEWMTEELVQSRLLERGMAQSLANAFRLQEPEGDAYAYAEYLVQLGLFSPFQTKRILEGEGRKLVIGPYTLLQLLAHGGMGSVYRAVGRADRRNYVVKLLPLRNQWNVRLARKQVESFERVPHHEGIVPFVDVGTANGQHYLVWPFVDGQSIERIVRDKGPMRVEEIARLGIQMVETFLVCHERNLVHGFLKPTNVMLGYDGQIRLLDFGIGSLLAENADEMDSMVDTIATAMTTASMLECSAPELILEPTNLTPASDQYSLGCVLYFCATGSYPFPDGTAMEKVFAHQKLKPQPIPHLNPKIPSTLVDVISRLMAKSPSDRYRRLEEMIVDLSPLTGREVKSLVPPTVPVDIQTPLKAKVFRARDLASAFTPEYAPSDFDDVPEAQVLSEVPAKEEPPKKQSWLRRLFFWWK